MIEFVITGHGEYSQGMLDALELIAGKQENISVVTFLPEVSVDEYRKKFQQTISSFSPEVEVFVFTDLLGGTPFKTAAELAISNSKITVFSGTNLGMLLEGVAIRSFETDSLKLSDSLHQAGVDNISIFSSARLNAD